MAWQRAGVRAPLLDGGPRPGAQHDACCRAGERGSFSKTSSSTTPGSSTHTRRRSTTPSVLRRRGRRSAGRGVPHQHRDRRFRPPARSHAGRDSSGGAGAVRGPRADGARPRGQSGRSAGARRGRSAIAMLATDAFRAGATWHLCGGQSTLSAGELIDLTMEVIRRHRPSWRRKAIERPAFVDLDTFELFWRSVEQVGDVAMRAATGIVAQFAPQLAFPKRFDDRSAGSALDAARGPASAHSRRLDEVVRGLVQHASVVVAPPDHRQCRLTRQARMTTFEARLLEFVRSELVASARRRRSTKTRICSMRADRFAEDPAAHRVHGDRDGRRRFRTGRRDGKLPHRSDDRARFAPGLHDG